MNDKKKYISGPAYHEIQGYMPKRKEFEVEYMNDAEQWIKDLAFYEDDDNEDTQLKLTMLDIYNSRLDRRMECKQFIFERHWLHFKSQRASERKKSKIEKKINQETKVFCRLQTAADYKAFVQGLVKEQELRERIHKLQEWRCKAGVCTIKQGEQYELDKQQRIQQLQLSLQNANDRLQLNPNHHSIDNYNNNNNHTVLRRLETITNQIPSTSSFSSSTTSTTAAPTNSPSPSSKPSTTVLLPNRPISKPIAPPTPPTPPPVIGRKPANPLDISNADGIELLSPEEKILCSTLRLLPKPYIVIKDTILKEYAKQGFLKRRATRALIKIDVNKTSRIYDFFIESGWITANKQ
ncbi:hypothetical protein BJ944DRAFT_260887 [Cunninghamella echinulata]|nr:hypothetical protein BJ944DRAFT_260887 [Cunninghamella echinulata]